jgi:hypothetical protein
VLLKTAVRQKINTTMTIDDSNHDGDDERTIIASSLPVVVRHRISDFLEHKDILRLASCPCKQNYTTRIRPFKELCVSPLDPPQELFFSQIFRAEAFSRRERIPILSKNCTHSIRLACQYKDQGYGERLGRLYVVAKSLVDQALSNRYKDGIVYMSPPAPHQYEDLEIIFEPREDERYELLYRVGGQGHLLMVENLLVSTIVLDDHDHNSAAVYGRLCELKMMDSEEDYNDDQDDDCNVLDQPNLVFGTKLLMAVVETLRGGLKAEKRHFSVLTDFFESNGLPTGSLDSVSKVCRFFLHHVDHQITMIQVQESQESPIIPLPADSTTNKQLPPFPLLAYGSWDESTRVQDIRIPTILGCTQSVRLTGQLKVEGSGEGQLYLLSRVSAERGRSLSLSSDQVVTRKTKIATFQQSEMLDFSFSPQDDEDAHFLRPACDANCMICVENLMSHLIVNEDKGGQDLAITYQAFLKCGALDTDMESRTFHLALLQAVATFLSSSSTAETTQVASFLDSCGFPTSTDGLTVLKDMSHSLMEFCNERKSASSGTTTGSNGREEGGLMYWTHTAM